MRACSLNAAYHPALCGAGIGSTAAPGAVAAPTTAPQSVRPFLLRKSSSLGLHPYEPEGEVTHRQPLLAAGERRWRGTVVGRSAG